MQSGKGMERVKTSSDERKEFIKLLKSLNEKEQIGLNLMIEGLMLLAKNKKSGVKTANHCLTLPLPL